MAVDLDPTAERKRGGCERGCLLADEQPGLTRRLNRGLLNRGDGGVEFLDGGRGDCDEAGVAEDAVSGREVGFLLKHVVVLGGLGGVLDLPDLRALGLVGDVLDLQAAYSADVY